MKNVFSINYENFISDEDFEYIKSLEENLSSLFDEVLQRFPERRLQLVDYILDNLADIIEDIHYYVLDVN